MENTMDQGTELQALQQAYAAELPQRLAAIAACWDRLCEQGWERQTLQQMHLLVHRLAGSGSTFGFPGLSETARDIEQGLRAWLEAGTLPGEPERQRIQPLLFQLAELGGAPQYPQGLLPIHRRSTKAQHERPLIYLLEDDRELARHLVRQLAHFGYDVHTFGNTAELERTVENRCPDALIMDIILPEGDSAGTQAAERIQQRFNEELPIIFQSRRDDFLARLGAVRAGASAYLVKPVDIDLVIEYLERFRGYREEAPYKIMLVDDDEPLAERTALVLRQAGMEVTVFNRTRDVLDGLMDKRPELILMDMYMQECSGLELTKIIRQHNEFLRIPIVYLSTETDIDLQMLAMRMGGDDFLTKPIEDGHLVDAVSIRAERARVLGKFMVLDSLTGLDNHTRLKEQLEAELSRCNRNGSCMSFAMLDIDHFKRVNDNYGHLTGDRIIRNLAKLIKRRVRKSDIVGRYGGEEFAVIFPDCNAENARQILDEIRRNFSQITHMHNNIAFRVTFSAGVAQYHTGMNAEQFTRVADESLYAAKEAGRNRVITHTGLR
ncbi:MAG: diguanylate cyclase [Candidatus Thiodiazotropha sp. (ex Dulcina madagascariensis)]|nr:diguanylate cyclase [Candidatus Thiodiazotropha sp. (ex Dulcina madagascariensis)]MCU7928298.1 diguanylate cyclase [Candidatus Thiodiazotropha sp. (ex Dulcina madagascariensis)]